MNKIKIVEMPILVDKACFSMYAGVLQNPLEKLKRKHQIDKVGVTRNFRDYVEEHKDDFKKKRMSGKPKAWWKKEYFKSLNCSSVSMQGYDRFIVWVDGNPIRFQKEYFRKLGMIDEELNEEIKIHEDNFLYPWLLNGNAAKIDLEKDFVWNNHRSPWLGNMGFMPDFHNVGLFISKKVLIFQGGWVERDDDGSGVRDDRHMGIFTDATFKYVEFNSDLYFPEDDATEVFDSLRDFFFSKQGKDFLISIGASRRKIIDNFQYSGGQIFIEMPKGMGDFKIYLKTKKTIRREVCLSHTEIIAKFGKKTHHLLNKCIEEIVKPLMVLTDIPNIINGKVRVRRDITDLILRYVPMDPKLRKFWYLAKRNVVISKELVPDDYLSTGKFKLVHCIRHKMGSGRASKTYRMYKLRDDLFGDDDKPVDEDTNDNEIVAR